MSDSGAETEAALLRGDRDALRADILVLGRHAWDIFATPDFLDAVQPRVVILAAPDPFAEGGNEPALRERLAATGAEIFHQELCGAVSLSFRGTHADISSHLGDRKFRLDPR